MSETYYAVDGRGRIARMEPKDLFAASKELKSLLEQNPGLIAGNPSESEQSGWLLLKESLAVEDPEFGDPPWVADLVFADQDRSPVFVQCVPSLEERSRREIIGEVMEHVASAQSCFGRATTPDAWGVDESDLSSRITGLGNGSGETAESVLQAVSGRLADGHLRLAYVTGRCPQEFRRVIDFLNRQMEHLRVVVVEVQAFQSNGFRMLIPTRFSAADAEIEDDQTVEPPVPPLVEPEAEEDPLDLAPLEVSFDSEALDEEAFGLESIEAETSDWEEASFFEAVESQLARAQVQAIRTFHQSVQKLHLDVGWRGDEEIGTLDVVIDSAMSEPIMSLQTDGALIFNFGHLDGDERLEDLQQRMRSIIDTRLGVVFHLDDLYPVMTAADWCPKVTGLLRVLDDLVKVANEES